MSFYFVSVFVFLTLVDIYGVIHWEKKEKIHRYVEISTFGLINYITLTFRANSFMQAYNLCDKTERKMKQLGVRIDFRICRGTILMLYVISFAAYSSMFVIFAISDKKLEIFLWETLVMGIPISLMTIPMFNSLCIGSLLYARFSEFNKLIKDQLCVRSRRVDVELISLAQIHSNFCKSTNQMIRAHEYVFLTYYLFTFVQLGEFVLTLTGYQKSALAYNDILWNTLFVLTNIGSLIMLTGLKYESSLTGAALCELTEAYFDDEMNEQVKLNLQRIQNKIGEHFFSVCIHRGIKI